MTSGPARIGSMPRARSRAVLTHEGGLHARPAIKLTQLAKRFDAAVWIALAEQGPWTDAKSIARVMAMKTPYRATLYFAAEGDDAEQASIALAKLVESDFADDGDHGGGGGDVTRAARVEPLRCRSCRGCRVRATCQHRAQRPDADPGRDHFFNSL